MSAHSMSIAAWLIPSSQRFSAFATFQPTFSRNPGSVVKHPNPALLATSRRRQCSCCSSSGPLMASWSPSLEMRLPMAELISFSLFSANRCSCVQGGGSVFNIWLRTRIQHFRIRLRRLRMIHLYKHEIVLDFNRYRLLLTISVPLEDQF